MKEVTKDDLVEALRQLRVILTDPYGCPKFMGLPNDYMIAMRAFALIDLADQQKERQREDTE
jgi:hypothetical protein